MIRLEWLQRCCLGTTGEQVAINCIYINQKSKPPYVFPSLKSKYPPLSTGTIRAMRTYGVFPIMQHPRSHPLNETNSKLLNSPHILAIMVSVIFQLNAETAVRPIPNHGEVCANRTVPITRHPQAHSLERTVESARNPKRYPLQNRSKPLKRVSVVDLSAPSHPAHENLPWSRLEV